jgi:hypothetical protein
LGRGGDMMQVMTGVMAVVGFQKKEWGWVGGVVWVGWRGHGAGGGEASGGGPVG